MQDMQDMQGMQDMRNMRDLRNRFPTSVKSATLCPRHVTQIFALTATGRPITKTRK